MSSGVETLRSTPVRGDDEWAAAGAGPWWCRPAVLRIAAGVLILAVWQFVVGSWAPHYVARPIGVVRDLPKVLTDNVFYHDLGSTLLAVVVGLLIALVGGSLLGLVVGRLGDVQRVLGMYVSGLYAMPIIALVPLITVWFGYSATTRLVVIVIEAGLPIVYSVAEGARAVPVMHIEVSRLYRAPWWRVWGGVVLPAAVPYVLAGVDLAIGRALIGAVAAEFIAAVHGLGYYVLSHVNSFKEDQAFVAVLALALLAVLLRAAVNGATRRWLRWYRQSG